AFHPAPMSGREMPPRIRATENIGPIASDWATAWIVESFFWPRVALGAVEPVSLMELFPPPVPAPLAPGTSAVYKGRTANVNPRHVRSCVLSGGLVSAR